MLSSFMQRRKAKKISLFDAAIRRVQSPPPSAPSTSLGNSSSQSSPQVFLELKDGFSDWFPLEILTGQTVDGEGRRDGVDLVKSKKLPSVPSSPSNSVHVSLSSGSLPSEAPSGSGNNSPAHEGATRKPTPMPLRIPSSTIEVHISGSDSKGASDRVHKLIQRPSPSLLSSVAHSRPSSIITTDDISAVSGTTLARALIANSFVLSNDNSRSRYRSGIVRQDSTTLPGGEYGLSYRERRVHGGDLVSPESGLCSSVPPVPPIPHHLDIALNADDMLWYNKDNSRNPKRSCSGHSSHRHSYSDEQRIRNRIPSRHEFRSTLHGTSRISSSLSPPPTQNTPSMPTLCTSKRQKVPPATTLVRGDSPDRRSVNYIRVDQASSERRLPRSLDLENSTDDNSEVLNIDQSPRSSIPSSRTNPHLQSHSYSADLEMSLAGDLSRRQSRGIGDQRRLVRVSSQKSRPSKESMSSQRRSVSSINSGDAPTEVPAPIQKRERLQPPTRPRPIDVPDEGLDLESFDGHDPSNTTFIGADGLQMFPETPAAFSPLLSAGSSVMPSSSLSISEFIFPGIPGSGFQSVGNANGRPLLPSMPIRTASLTKKRLPHSSVKPEMSPIPSTPANLLSSFQDGKDMDTNDQNSSCEDVSKLRSSTPSVSSAPGLLVAKPEHLSVQDSSNSSSEGATNTIISLSGSNDALSASTRSSISNYSDREYSGNGDPVRHNMENTHTDSSVMELGYNVEDRLPSANVKPFHRTIPPPLELPQCHSRSVSPAAIRRIPEDPSQPSQGPQPLLPAQLLSEVPAPKVFTDPFSTFPSAHSSITQDSSFSILPTESHNKVVKPALLRSESSSSSQERFADFSMQNQEFTERPRSTDRPESVNGRRAWGRPPLPHGPRELSATNASLLAAMTQRKASVSSLASAGQGEDDGQRIRQPSLRSLDQRPHRFQTTPVRWRGLPLDVAKWTFTSQELQQLVSRAIKHSAGASSVRLLKADILDNEIPEEMHRLELLTTDIKARYKTFVGRRRDLLHRLSYHADGSDLIDSPALSRVIEELADVSENIEQLAEELYNVTDQLAQLKRLCDVHSGSALSVALKKLYSTFIRQSTEAQLQRDRIAALEAERDDLFSDPESANEFNHLSNGMESQFRRVATLEHQSNSRHASGTSTSRSSVTAMKFGSAPLLQRKSQRPSSPPVTSALSMRDHFRPPIVRMPSPDLPISNSSYGGVYNDPTPTTESRALAKAQKELCDILGINVKDIQDGPQRPYSICSVRKRTTSTALKRARSDVRTNHRNFEIYP